MGGRVGVIEVPSLVKALDLLINSARAAMPSFVPRRTDRVRDLEAFSRILRCWEYLVQSRRMWFLVSIVSSSSSQGHVMGSGERGRKDLLNSPV